MAELTVEVEPAEVGLDEQRLQRVDRLLQRYVDDGRLPGWSLLVTRRGAVAHVTHGGRRNVADGLPVEPDTVFRIFSMTKPITSVAAMMLWEQGLLQLTDPVSRWLPEFADVRVFTGGSDLRPVTVPATEPVRVWHLLTHTAGLTYGFHHAHPVDALLRAAGYEWTMAPGADLTSAVQTFASLPLLFQPGAEWNYSVATDVLGRLVEVVAGRPFDEVLQESIFAPLGMTDTAFGGSDPARTAALYTVGLHRSLQLEESVDRPEFPSGGGGLVSTLHDYHRFTQLLRGGGELDGVRLLGERTVRYMTTNHLPGHVDLAAFGRPLFAEAPFDGVGFGLGFSVVLDPVATHTHGSVGEYAWGGAASTAFWVDPVEDLTVVFLTQLMPSSTYPLRAQLRQLVYSALVDPSQR